MKKIVVFLFVLFSTLLNYSCELYNYTADAIYSDMASGHDLYYLEDYDDLTNVYLISNYIDRNVRYKSEDVDRWSNPENTINRGYGDCEDFAILFMCIAYYSMGIKYDLVLVDDSRKIEDGGFTNHACVRYNGKVIDPIIGRPVDYDVCFSYSFDKVFDL